MSGQLLFVLVVLGGLLLGTIGGLVTYVAYRHRDLGVALLVGIGAVSLIAAILALGAMTAAG
ncbi:hypothetical protein QF035_000086 [Streptomyces umbrinus]|uniref:Major facilitator superfamily (MFS) profile domain-containing protein n=1 Tax=Streptomyces umbrinus TaxID=67370 RepID=A0ABU0SG32_9ACTN|nr:hypothetical protein [Streptomyces umbrinus]MDQ1022504.1 hypothetical protein [Streptomyces umbrinus]